MGPREDESLDGILQGRLKVIQKVKGYRFSLEPILLCHFVSPVKGKRILDLGTGCGIIPLILAWKDESLRITGVEIQEELAELAQRNVQANGLSDRIEILQGDLKRIDRNLAKGSFDLVLSNPPFRRPDSGRINPLSQKAIARHEVLASMEDVVRCSRELLAPKGRLALIYPAYRTVDLFYTLRRARLEPKRFRAIHSSLRSPAKMVLVEARKGGGKDLKCLPPLVLYEDSGEYTPEMKEIYGTAASHAETSPERLAKGSSTHPMSR